MQVNYKQVSSIDEEIAEIKAVEKTAEIESAIELLQSGTQSIAVIKDGETHLCRINAIYYIESVDKRTYIYTKDNCYETKLRLYELEEKLGIFYARCSKAMIINLKKIKSVSSEISGRMNAILLNGESVVISRSYVKEIKRRLEI